MKKAVIFDLDGTLWNSTSRLVESYNQVLARYPELNLRVNQERLESGMGMNRVALRRHLFPSVDEAMQETLIAQCFDEEIIYLREEYGKPYPHLKETLEQLSRDYTLAIVSNCQEGYVEVFLETIGVGEYIADHECFATGLPKGENIKLVMERQGIDLAIYVGDTQGDLNAADLAGVPFVYAAYGFGSVDRETHAIQSLAELPALAAELLK